MPTATKDELRSRAIKVSVAVSVLILAGKLWAFAATYSTALLVDAAESVVHLVVIGFSAFSIWFAARPADMSHPYGHRRIVYFAVGFEGALVTGASICAFAIAVVALLRGHQLHSAGVGLAIGTPVAIVNAGLASWLHVQGRRTGSAVLRSGARHIWADVATTVAALAGVALTSMTEQSWWDPVAALAVSAGIFFAGFALLRQSVAGLMDHVDPAALTSAVECLTVGVRSGKIRGYHQLRGRLLDDQLWIDVHLQVPSDMTVSDAHRRATAIEGSIRAAYRDRDVHITTHIEPEGHDDAHPVGHEDTDDPFSSQGPEVRL